MKTCTIILSLLLLFLIIACENNNENTPETNGFGTVMVSGGLLGCNTWIEMDDGTKLIPINWTDYNLVSNQRAEVNYKTVEKQTTCDGLDCILLKYTAISCTPYVNLYFHNIDSLKLDPVIVQDAQIENDCLKIKLTYSGGCEVHLIDLARIHPSCGTPPLPPPTFEIRHDSNGDNCEAAITKEFMFDLSPLKDEFNEDVTIVLYANEGNGSSYNTELTYEIKQ